MTIFVPEKKRGGRSGGSGRGPLRRLAAWCWRHLIPASLALIVACALLGAGYALGSAGRSGGDVAARPAPGTGGGVAAADAAPSPARVVAGVRVGWPHSRAGAQSAAEEYLEALWGPRLLDEGQRDAVIQTIAAPESIASYTSSIATALDAVDQSTHLLRDVASGTPGVYLTRALATPQIAPGGAGYTGDTAELTVWIIQIQGAATTQLALPRDSYSTVTVDLRWVGAPGGGDWKLVRTLSRPGPAPARDMQVSPPSDPTTLVTTAESMQGVS
jgi:hypothetical protein